MKKALIHVILLLISLITTSLHSQVTVGSSEKPLSGALLDLKENTNGLSTKGLGLPRVALSEPDKLYPMLPVGYDPSEDEKHTGLIVYNTYNAMCGEMSTGVYFWNGDRWVQISGAPSIGNYESDVEVLKTIYNNNPGNTLGWNLSGDPLNSTDFPGVSWEMKCGEERVVDINIVGKKLSDLTGIKKLEMLESLNCSHNYTLTNLDLSGMPHLKILYSYINTGLTNLNVSGATALTNITCNNNALTNLNVSGAISLKEIICNLNSLVNLDLSEAVNLESLDCSYNSLTHLELPENLKELNCGNNSLSHLDISKLTKLYRFGCEYNSLVDLDVSNNTDLFIFACGKNLLTELNISMLVNIGHFSCRDNKLTSLDISKNINLVYLACDSNHLTQEELEKLKNNPNYCNILTKSSIPQYIPGTTTMDPSVTEPVCP